MIAISVPHRVTCREANTWCRQQFGLVGYDTTRPNRWDYNANVFYFRDEEDAVLFKLRWTWSP